MKLPRRTFLHLAAGAAALNLLLPMTHGAWPQTARTIKIVVTFPVGGGGDIMTRVLSEQIARSRGVTLAVENLASARGTEAVVRAAPDGNTLVVINNNFVVDSHFRKLAYDPLTDLEPICNLASAQTLVVVNGTSPYRTHADLITASKQRPGEITMVAGPGSTAHIGMEALKRAANVNMTFVPVAGGGAAVGGGATMNAVLTERATWSIQTYQNSLEHMKTGKLRALATTSRKRLDTLPDLPTVAEAGYKEYEVDLWDGVFAPANTPKDTVSQLVDWFSAALQVPEVRSKIGVEAFIPVGVCGADFVAFIRKQHDEYGRVIREANIKLP